MRDTFRRRATINLRLLTTRLYFTLTFEISLLQHSVPTASRQQQDALLLSSSEHQYWQQSSASHKSLSQQSGRLLAAVADGASTSPHAAFASRSLLQVLQTHSLQSNAELPPLVRHSHSTWQTQCAKPHTRGASTTLAALLVHDEQACVVNIGDSRVWRIRPTAGIAVCHQISRDHTLWQQQRDQGDQQESDFAPANLYQALSHSLTLGDPNTGVHAMHIWRSQLRPGDIFLLATDGLHGSAAPFKLHSHWDAHLSVQHNLYQLFALWGRRRRIDDCPALLPRYAERARSNSFVIDRGALDTADRIAKAAQPPFQHGGFHHRGVNHVRII